jgi:GxxExxY protein
MPEVSFSESDYPRQELTRDIIGACYSVHNVLGFGFLETVYKRALMSELALRGIKAQAEVAFQLHYRGAPIGLYYADLIVESQVIVEVKTGLFLDPASVSQALNYLGASGLSVGLVLYFGPRVKVRRVVKTEEHRRRLNA